MGKEGNKGMGNRISGASSVSYRLSFLVLSWLYDLPVVLIFTVSHVIPVTEYGHTFQKNLKKNVFPEVKTKNIHTFPSLFTFVTSKWRLPYARARL